jgi:hypothetical protein
MKNSRFWILFAGCALCWLIVAVSLAPNMSGEDVYIFRDAGWNLASSGSFESAALMYMYDLTPRLNSHYTPLMPLLFAGYAAVFPRNAYAGTVFNLLLGLLAAAVLLRLTLRQPAGKLRNLAALMIAALPVLFVTYDRPEALALVLFSATVALAASAPARPALVGLLIASTFLGHPFAAIAAAIWTCALFLRRNWADPRRWLLTASQTATAGICAAIPVAAVAWLYYAIDHESLQRFAAHSLGHFSGIHTVKSGGWSYAIHKAMFGLSALGTFNYFSSLAVTVLLIGWAIFKRRELMVGEILPVAAGIACTLISIVLFSIQANYIYLLAFLIPAGLLIASGVGGRLAAPAFGLVIFALMMRVPAYGLDLLERIEQVPSYEAARTQPATLRASVADPEAIVVEEGDSYDLFKPEFHHLIRLEDVQDVDHYRAVAAVANCYDAFHGTADAVRPLPAKLDASQFQLIERAPRHMWVTLLGHKAMRGQWGYGCDLYLRNSAAAGKGPEGIQATQ